MSEEFPKQPLSVKSRIIAILLLLLAGAGIALALVKLKPEPEKVDRKVDGLLVEVQAAETKSVTMSVDSFGTVEAKHQVTEVAEVPGRITMLSPKLKEGMFFRKGDTLIQIDPRSFALAVDRFKAQRDAANAELKRLKSEQDSNEKMLALTKEDTTLAERELDRQADLQKSNTVAEAAVELARRQALTARQQQQRIENTLEALKAQLASAEAQVDMAEANLAEAELNLEKTTIIAPFDGRTMEQIVEEGQFVTVGQRLATIYDTSAVEVSVNLPYEDLQWLDLTGVTLPLRSENADQPEESDAPRPAALATLETANRTYQWNGYISRVAGIVDRATRTVPVIVEFPNPWSGFDSDSGVPPLVPGMFVKVQIEGRRFEQIFEIPRSALRDRNEVFIADSNQLRIRRAMVLRSVGNTAYLSAGLNAGDMIILSPISTAVDGMKIRTILAGANKPPSDEATPAGNLTP